METTNQGQPNIKAPFPYFGGKSKVASVVWERFGDVSNYVEPFCGSMAVLLGRPADHRGRCETVNDKNHFIANFWRAVKNDPEAVADWADWPVNESDLFPRHKWLVTEGAERIAGINDDPFLYDPQVAGWWLWGQCAWIGSGWCSSKINNKLIHLGHAGQGINRKIPNQIPDIGSAGKGINRKIPNQIPHLGHAGQGINRIIPHLGSTGRGINLVCNATNRREYIMEQMQQLACRLRDVRVCCGDWKRVLTRGALHYGSSVGIFLDPPYSYTTGRAKGCYTDEMQDTSEVRQWAIEHGDDPRLRIALCGYEGEHEIPDTWEKYEWKANASYKTHRGDQTGNRHRERIWFSPHCLRANTTQDKTSMDTLFCLL